MFENNIISILFAELGLTAQSKICTDCDESEDGTINVSFDGIESDNINGTQFDHYKMCLIRFGSSAEQTVREMLNLCHTRLPNTIVEISRCSLNPENIVMVSKIRRIP